jgi:hypothetical protein
MQRPICNVVMELVRNVTVGLMKATIRPVPTEAVDTLSKTTGNFGKHPYSRQIRRGLRPWLPWHGGPGSLNPALHRSPPGGSRLFRQPLPDGQTDSLVRSAAHARIAQGISGHVLPPQAELRSLQEPCGSREAR